MAQLPTQVVPYSFSARVLIRPGTVTILQDGAPPSPDVVDSKLTLTRRFEDDPRALEEESGTSDEEDSGMLPKSLHATSRSTLRPSRAKGSARVAAPVGSGWVEADHSLSEVTPSRSATPAPSIIHVHVSQSRQGTPAHSRQPTPQPSTSSAPPESNRGRTQKPSSHFPSLDDLSSMLKNRCVTRSASRSSLNIEQCHLDSPSSSTSANRGSASTYRAAPVIDDDDDDFSQYERITKKCLQTDEEKTAGKKYLTAWFYSEAGYSLSAPPTGMAKHPRLEIGDLFFHVVTHLEEPQMWMWVETSDGKRLWKIVVKGESRREDNRRLIVGSDSKKTVKKPVWVTDTWYKKMVMKDTAKNKGKGKTVARLRLLRTAFSGRSTIPHAHVRPVSSSKTMPTVCKCTQCLRYRYQAIDGSYKRGRKVSEVVARDHKLASAMTQRLEMEAHHLSRKKEDKSVKDGGSKASDRSKSRGVQHPFSEKESRSSEGRGNNGDNVGGDDPSKSNDHLNGVIVIQQSRRSGSSKEDWRSSGSRKGEGGGTQPTEDETIAGNAIFLATFQEDKPRELPVREHDHVCSNFSAAPRASVFDADGAESVEEVSADPAPSLAGRSQMPDEISDEDIRRRTRELGALESSFTLRSRVITRYMELKFESPPVSSTDPPTELERRHFNSAMVQDHRGWVALELGTLGSLPPVNDKQADKHRDVLIRDFKKELTRLDDIVQRAWEREMAAAGFIRITDKGVLPPISVEPLDIFDPDHTEIPHFILAALFMVTILHTLASVARPYTQFILATIQVLLFGALAWSTNPLAKAVLDASQKALLKCIPLDIRTALSLFELEPDIVLYAVCPTCNSTYPPDPRKPDDPYPHYCMYQETDKPVCGATLVSEVQLAPPRGKKLARIAYRPLRSYPYHSIKSYLARLFCRLEAENLMESSWDRPATGKDGPWEDIIDAPAFREFLGPDGKTRFSVQTDSCINLVFSLFIDWFNPYGNKQAGKSHSIGAVYLINNNLPPHLRFRPEYVYLAAVIPGPKEPSLDQINHFLHPLVDEFLELWHLGIYLERTAARSAGRLIRAAIILLICDLPALRKAAGFVHYSSHHFCSMCPLPKDQISNAERSTWPKSRSWEEHLQIARKWRDAATDKERKEIFNRFGLRWSELLRLEYWNPTKYAVVDTMHNLFLGELRHHCMEVWGISGIGESSSPRALASHSSDDQRVHLDRVLRALLEESREKAGKKLMAIRRDYLLAIAKYNNISLPDGELLKREVADALVAWVRHFKHHK
ncbi:hypothetical protein GSI_08522 [Ganoderma sinense ZZ0214-1]|uniref:Uncharacterized protein n=1 Tax=Ganoderma sinense ZZ0214-1 TaxID=1077348 RepID=A0A2G8S424_9APHY|nr:hypothetical protein GSI_08522 [Ganoderma sinense ZZ0214-1]